GLVPRPPRRVDVPPGDVRGARPVARAVGGVDAVFHSAAQVAVTRSLLEPLHDFEVNARGAVNVLEAIRRFKKRPSVVFTSTNKAYADLADVSLVEEESRYAPSDPLLRRRGSRAAPPPPVHS